MAPGRPSPSDRRPRARPFRRRSCSPSTRSRPTPVLRRCGTAPHPGSGTTPLADPPPPGSMNCRPSRRLLPTPATRRHRHLQHSASGRSPDGVFSLSASLPQQATSPEVRSAQLRVPLASTSSNVPEGGGSFDWPRGWLPQQAISPESSQRARVIVAHADRAVGPGGRVHPIPVVPTPAGDLPRLPYRACEPASSAQRLESP